MNKQETFTIYWPDTWTFDEMKAWMNSHHELLTLNPLYIINSYEMTVVFL